MLLLLLATVLLSYPALFSNGAYPSGIDTPAHLFKVEVMQDMMQKHGQIFHWTDQWYGGYPFLSLYAPLSFYVLYGINQIFHDLTTSFNLLRAFLLFLTSALLYFIIDREVEDRIVSIGTGILTLTAYPIYNNLFTIGRIAFAFGIVLYLASIYFLLSEKIYSSEVNNYHVYLGIILSLLVFSHPMSAYLLAYSGIIALFVYRERLKRLELKPIIFTGVLTSVLSMPYITSFIQSSYITDPFWIQRKLKFNQFVEFISRRFGDTLPQYMGAIHVALGLAGLISILYERSKFGVFISLNFLLFFAFFWSADLNILHLIPMGNQFDLSRFQAFFTLYSILIAGFGLREIFSIFSFDRRIVLALILLVVAVDVAPMVSESSNWSPKFEKDVSQIQLDDSHRAMTVGMRHWDDYIVPAEMGLENTMGWFQQADPHYNFTQTLQNTGGVWYPIDRHFPRNKDPLLRKNLMQLSNTKYVIFGKDWAPREAKGYLLGNYVPMHKKNKKLLNQVQNDSEYSEVYNSSSLEIYSLQRELGLCQPVEPVGIEENYFNKSVELLSTTQAFPNVPVRGKLENRTDKGINNVLCNQINPYKVSIDVDSPGWVLISNSYYPFWKRQNGKNVYNAFGFIVTHVEGEGKLVFDPGTGGIRS